MVRAVAMLVVIMVLLDTSSVEARSECTELCARVRSGRLETRAAGLKAEAAESRHRPVEGGSHSVRPCGGRVRATTQSIQHSTVCKPMSSDCHIVRQYSTGRARAFKQKHTAQHSSNAHVLCYVLPWTVKSRLDVVANSGVLLE